MEREFRFLVEALELADQYLTGRPSYEREQKLRALLFAMHRDCLCRKLDARDFLLTTALSLGVRLREEELE